MFFDYHIHLENGPLDMEWLERFAEAAVARGVSEIGVSEHIFKFTEAGPLWPSWWRLTPDRSLEDYVDLIAAARAKNLPVKMGIECEYLTGIEKRLAAFLEGVPWDYVIGSVHFIDEWGFDDTDRLDTWDGRDVDDAYRRYFSLLDEAMTCGLFDMIGHPDVIKVFGHRASFDLRPLYDTVAATARRAGVVAEVSTAGLRKMVGEMYPHFEFLRALSREGVPIAISSDAHYPEHVGYEFAHAARYAAAAGYTRVTRFAGRKVYGEPLG
ncbi:MAG: histidinol-phosphatase [Firmicutes bacterium]|nr:histidinol-phosphatase [Bacillota bacterium]